MFFTNKPLCFLAVAFAFVFSNIALVRAQSGSETATSASASGTAGIGPCLLGCVQTAASAAGCSSATDLTCICSSSSFQSSALSCLQQSCPSSVLPQAQALQSQQCAAVSAASSATSGAESGTATGSSAVSSTHSSATSHTASASGSGTSSASSSSFASSKSNFGLGGVLSVIVGFLGIILGALVL